MSEEYVAAQTATEDALEPIFVGKTGVGLNLL
jgi:hypothetical protein